MMGGRILNCVYCKNVSIHTASKHIRTFVCDDCYEKNQAEKKRLTKNDKKTKGRYNRYRHGGRKGER
jgi:hypothetical protein